MEKGHYDVSVAVAKQQLLPAVRSIAADTTTLADGYSCRTQLADLSHRRGQHLAELLAKRRQPPGTVHREARTIKPQVTLQIRAKTRLHVGLHCAGASRLRRHPRNRIARTASP